MCVLICKVLKDMFGIKVIDQTLNDWHKSCVILGVLMFGLLVCCFLDIFIFCKYALWKPVFEHA